MQPEKLSVSRTEKYLRRAPTCQSNEVCRYRRRQFDARDLAYAAAKGKKANGTAVPAWA
jgi:hypothetical protein